MLHKLKEIFWWPGLTAIVIYRMAHACGDGSILKRTVARLLYRLNITLHGTDIDPLAIIGKNFKITHPVGVVIGKCKIGDNVEIFHNVTLGQRCPSLNDGFPTIGDNVVLYAGAVIIGPVMVGEGARIGANAVVLTDIPSHATAMGVPAKFVIGKR